MIQQQPSDGVVVQTILQMYGITQETFVQELEKIIQETARQELLFWDIDDIMRATTFSKAFLEEYILCDPRIRQYMRQRGPRSKRVWLYEPTAQVLKDIIMNEWN